MEDQHTNEMMAEEDGVYEVSIRNACGELPEWEVFRIEGGEVPDVPVAGLIELPCGEGVAKVTLADGVVGTVGWYDENQELIAENGESEHEYEIAEDVRVYIDRVGLHGCRSDKVGVDLRVRFAYPVRIGDFSVWQNDSLMVVPLDVPEDGRFRWLPEDGALKYPDTRTPVFYPGHEWTKKYVLEYTSPDGCLSVDSTFIRIIPACRISEVITPNGDGFNDFWIIDGIEVFPDNEVVIYDRSGKEVYRAKPYQNHWDGTSVEGERLPSGSYLYKISRIERKVMYGMVAIVRN